MSDPYVRLRRGGGALGMEGAKATGGVELGRTAPRMNTHDVTFSVLTIHGIEEVEQGKAGATRVREEPLQLHIDVLDKDFKTEDDPIGSLPLWPLFAGGALEGKQAETPIRSADGKFAGTISFSWRLQLTRELIDMWSERRR